VLGTTREREIEKESGGKRRRRRRGDDKTPTFLSFVHLHTYSLCVKNDAPMVLGTFPANEPSTYRITSEVFPTPARKKERKRRCVGCLFVSPSLSLPCFGLPRTLAA
jgi:hypothetical protein